MSEKPVPTHDEAVTPVTPVTSSSQDAVRLDDSVLARMAQSIDNFELITKDAQLATEFERKMTIGQGLRMYPKAAIFSIILSLSLVMEGYDTSLLGGFFGYPSFQKKFGSQIGPDKYSLSAEWQSGLQNGVQVGEIIGLWLAGTIAEKYGYKKTMLGSLIMMIGVIFIMFFAQNIGMLFAGEILCGLVRFHPLVILDDACAAAHINNSGLTSLAK